MRWLLAAAAGACLLRAQSPAEFERLMDRQEFAAASALAARMAEQEGVGARWWVAKGRAALGLGDAAAAWAALAKAVERDPNDMDALYYLAELAAVRSQMEFDRLLTRWPNAARSHQLKAELASARGDAAGEEREYRRALEADPTLPAALVGYAEFLREKNRCGEALPLYERALKMTPDGFEANYGRGACLLSSDRASAAVAPLQNAVRIDGSSLAARIALGSALLQAGRFAESAAHLESAVQLDPKAKQPYFLLGRCYQKMGRAVEAEKAFATYRALGSP